MSNTCQRKGQRQGQERGKKPQDILLVLRRIPSSMPCWPRARPLAPPADKKVWRKLEGPGGMNLEEKHKPQVVPRAEEMDENLQTGPSQKLTGPWERRVWQPPGASNSGLHYSAIIAQWYHIPPFSHLSIIPIYVLLSLYFHFFFFLLHHLSTAFLSGPLQPPYYLEVIIRKVMRRNRFRNFV